MPLLGRLSDAAQVALDCGATGAIVATTALDSERSNRIARQLVDAGLHVELSSSLRDIRSGRLLVQPLGSYSVLYLEPVRRGGWRAVAKRMFDIVVSATALFFFAPLMGLIAIAVKLDSKGSVFFRQRRVGRNATLFTIYKFRTMVTDAELHLRDLAEFNEADGPLFKIRNDPRITRVGRVLRRLSLDELPQFWNVLRGEMSIVGPRPALPEEALRWDPELRQRLRVKPGVTGMWQVSGRSNASFAHDARMDLYYVDNWSLFTDIGLVFRTIPDPAQVARGLLNHDASVRVGGRYASVPKPRLMDGCGCRNSQSPAPLRHWMAEVAHVADRSDRHDPVSGLLLPGTGHLGHLPALRNDHW